MRHNSIPFVYILASYSVSPWQTQKLNNQCLHRRYGHHTDIVNCGQNIGCLWRSWWEPKCNIPHHIHFCRHLALFFDLSSVVLNSNDESTILKSHFIGTAYCENLITITISRWLSAIEDVTSLLTHWSYVFLALTHRHILVKLVGT